MYLENLFINNYGEQSNKKTFLCNGKMYSCQNTQVGCDTIFTNKNKLHFTQEMYPKSSFNNKHMFEYSKGRNFSSESTQPIRCHKG